MKIADHYRVLRVWFDKETNPMRPGILETSQFKPINLVALFHHLEAESAEWASRTGGSIVELHLYNTPQYRSLSKEDIWKNVQNTFFEILPELKNANVLGMSVTTGDDFTSYAVGQGKIRPFSHEPANIGISNLFFAGDWVATSYPAALMEKAVATGREAANQILIQDNVKQVPIKAASNYGPGWPLR